MTALPPGAFEAEWVKSRDKVVPIMDEICLRLHDRYSERPGTFELVGGDAFAALMELETITETYPAGNLASRDGFARDCLLQRRVSCEPGFSGGHPINAFFIVERQHVPYGSNRGGVAPARERQLHPSKPTIRRLN